MNSRRVGLSSRNPPQRPLLSTFRGQTSVPVSQPKREPEEIEASTQEGDDSIIAPPMVSSDSDSDGLPGRGDLGGGKLPSCSTTAQPGSDTTPPPQQSRPDFARDDNHKRSALEGPDSVFLSPRTRQEPKRTKQEPKDDPSWMAKDDPVRRNSQNKDFKYGKTRIFRAKDKKRQAIRAPRLKGTASANISRGSLSPKPTFRTFQITVDSSPEKSPAKLQKSFHTSLPDRSPAAKARFHKTQSSRNIEKEVPAPVFKSYQSLSSGDECTGDKAPFRGRDSPDVNDAASESPLSDIPSDELVIRSDIEQAMEVARCPVCGKKVEKDILSKFSKSSSMSLDQQMKFCKHHQTHSARQTWKEKGWPDIKWNQLDARMEKCHEFLEGVLMGNESHFRSLLGEAVREGKNRTLKKSDGRLTPGYYGLRGFRAMSDHIVHHFGRLLRKQAVRDKLVSSRGHTGYVQSVMVPELAVRLIMEDMGAGAEEAREILFESAEIGELLNDEIKDVVLQDQDEDEDEIDSEGSEVL